MHGELRWHSASRGQAGAERQLKSRGKGKQDAQNLPKVMQIRPGIFNTRSLRATSSQEPIGPVAQIEDLVPTQIAQLLHDSGMEP